jgi:hypothetical protein
MSFRSFRATATGDSHEAMPLPLRWPPSFRLPGRFHWLCCCSAGRASVGNETCPEANVEETWRACSPREAHLRAESAS